MRRRKKKDIFLIKSNSALGKLPRKDDEISNVVLYQALVQEVEATPPNSGEAEPGQMRQYQVGERENILVAQNISAVTLSHSLLLWLRISILPGNILL